MKLNLTVSEEVYNKLKEYSEIMEESVEVTSSILLSLTLTDIENRRKANETTKNTGKA